MGATSTYVAHRAGCRYCTALRAGHAWGVPGRGAWLVCEGRLRGGPVLDLCVLPARQRIWTGSSAPDVVSEFDLVQPQASTFVLYFTHLAPGVTESESLTIEKGP